MLAAPEHRHCHPGHPNPNRSAQTMHRQVLDFVLEALLFSWPPSPRRGKRDWGGGVKQDPSILNLLSLGVGGRRPFQLLFRSPVGGKKRPNLEARLETNPPAILPMGGVSTSDWRARTWRRLNNPSRTRLCKSAGAPPPLPHTALRMHFALGSTAMQTDTHMHARKKKKKKTPANVSGGGRCPS